MLKLIEGFEENQVLHKRFQRKLVGSASTDPKTLEFGYQGGGRAAHAVWYREGNWWYGYRAFKGSYWNAFGLGNALLSKGQRNIVVEINPPPFGLNRKIQGAFAIDDEAREWLIHRGRLGGGREGIGKDFLEWYPRDAKRQMKDGNRTSEVILVGHINDESFLNAVRGFVGLAHAFKAARETDPTSTDVEVVLQNLYRPAYHPEYSGTSIYAKPEREIAAEWRHGRVVAALHRELRILGFEAYNDDGRDLYLTVGSELVVLFEVKTSISLQTIYTAVGQLAWHSSPSCRRIGVFPREVPESSRGRLRELGVHCVFYDWSDGIPKFEGLVAALRL